MGNKGEETKKLIREKACSLFARKGFKNVTMKDICVATGLSRGGLYRHYDSTQQVFSEIIDDLRALKGGEVGYGTILVDYHCCGFDCRWLT